MAGILRLAVAALIACAVTATGAASAQDAPWSGGGPGSTTIVSDGQASPAQFSYHVDPAGYDTNTWTFSTVALNTRTVVLKYTYTGLHAWFYVMVGLVAFAGGTDGEAQQILVNDGPAICCTAPSDGFSYTGTVTLSVQAGYGYGFRMSGSNYDYNNFLNGNIVIEEVPSYSVEALFDETKLHKLGSTIPIKIQVFDDDGLNVSAPDLQVTAVGIVKVGGEVDATGIVEDSGEANPDNNFRYDATLEGYIFNLSTKPGATELTPGTWSLKFRVGGGSRIHAVQFVLR